MPLPFPERRLRAAALVPPTRLKDEALPGSKSALTPLPFGWALLPAGLTPRKQPSTTLLLDRTIRTPPLHPWLSTNPRMVLPPPPKRSRPSLPLRIAPLISISSVPLKPLGRVLVLGLEPACV